MCSVFSFKQFKVDQDGCAMKVNTDAVLLAALASPENHVRILDAGTGTGVIALMLAQLYPQAYIDAVEMDAEAADTAAKNFANSHFAGRLTSYSSSFEDYFRDYPERKYDLIISNPPFFINSLKSDDPLKQLARHTNGLFFQNLLSASAIHLTENGSVVLIVPLTTADLVKKLSSNYCFNIQAEVLIHSFDSSKPHRSILTLGRKCVKQEIRKFVIYQQPGVYSDEYASLLKDFLTIF